jgi:hypothetical protein
LSKICQAQIYISNPFTRILVVVETTSKRFNYRVVEADIEKAVSRTLKGSVETVYDGSTA